jgi:lycopene beta-cyclase
MLWPVAADQTEVDVAVVGAGGAGLSLVIALERAARQAGRPAPSIVVVDPVHRRQTDRTWCWWARAPVPPLVHRAWSRMELVDRAGCSRSYELGDLRYVMLRSGDFYAEADAALARLAGSSRVTGTVDRVDDGPRRAVVQVGELQINARWVFDSRPAAPRRPGRTQLLPHVRGWRVRGQVTVILALLGALG